jgi:hypothetical protein
MINSTRKYMLIVYELTINEVYEHIFMYDRMNILEWDLNMKAVHPTSIYAESLTFFTFKVQ